MHRSPQIRPVPVQVAASSEVAAFDEVAVPSLAAAVTELSSRVSSASDIVQALVGVADVCASVVRNASSVSVTLLRDQKPYTIATSGPQAVELDEAQYAHGQGPCLSALGTGYPSDAPDLRTEPRWAGYGKLATSRGVAAAYSYPLPSDDQAWGALNVYAEQANAFAGQDREQVAVLAHQAAISLTVLIAQHDQALKTRQLQQALTSRTTIDVAKGILVAEHGVTPDAAFDLLRSLSQQRNVKLRDVAAELVASRSAGGTNPSADATP